MHRAQIEVIQADDVPAPNGHYSHAIACDGVVYVSGQLGRGPGMSDAQAGDILTQTRRSLAGIDAILRASGSELSRLLKVNVYLTDIANWPAVNAVYREVLAAHRPARAVVAVGPLHFGALIEIDAIGAIGPGTSINPRLPRPPALRRLLQTRDPAADPSGAASARRGRRTSRNAQ